MCPGVHTTYTRLFSDNAVTLSMPFASSWNLGHACTSAVIAAWPSEQMQICSLNSFFFRRPAAWVNVAATSATKAVASYPTRMCLGFSLLSLHPLAPTCCWLQAPSVNQARSFFSRSNQSFSYSSLVGIITRYGLSCEYLRKLLFSIFDEEKFPN